MYAFFFGSPIYEDKSSINMLFRIMEVNPEEITKMLKGLSLRKRKWGPI